MSMEERSSKITLNSISNAVTLLTILRLVAVWVTEMAMTIKIPNMPLIASHSATFIWMTSMLDRSGAQPNTHANNAFKTAPAAATKPIRGPPTHSSNVGCCIGVNAGEKTDMSSELLVLENGTLETFTETLSEEVPLGMNEDISPLPRNTDCYVWKNKLVCGSGWRTFSCSDDFW